MMSFSVSTWEIMMSSSVMAMAKYCSVFECRLSKQAYIASQRYRVGQHIEHVYVSITCRHLMPWIRIFLPRFESHHAASCL
jgi:hypothetical protein